MLPTRDPTQDKRPTQWKVKGWKKNIISKWTGKQCQGSNTHIRQNRLQNKGHKNRHRRTLHILKERIHQEDINIIKIYAPNIGAPKYI